MKKMFKEVSERVLNDLQSSAFKVGVTRTGTKENTAAKAALELAKNALNAIWKEADQKYVRMAMSGKRDSEKAKELLEIKLSIDSEIIFHRELIGTTDATNLKKSSTNEEMIAYRKSLRTGQVSYNPEYQEIKFESRLQLTKLDYAIKNNFVGQVKEAIDTLQIIVDKLHKLNPDVADVTANEIEKQIQKVTGKDSSPKVTEADVIDDYIVTQDAQLEAQATEQAEANISAIHRKVEENPDLEMRAAVNRWMKSDDNTKSETIDTAKSPFTSEETKLLDKIEKAAFDNIIYQHGNHELAHQAAIDGDTANTELGKLAITARKNGDEEHFKLLFDEVQARINHAAAFAGKIESSAGQYIRGELTYQPFGNRSICLEKLETEVGNKVTMLDNLATNSKNAKLQSTANNKPVFTKVDYANNLANAISNSNSKRRRWDVYTIKNASALKGFDDIRDAANKVLNEGFDSFTVGDYFRLIA